MLITGSACGGTGQTWRPPVMARLAMAVCLGIVTALPALWLALTLVTNQAPDGGWLALALAVAAWGLLAWRALTQSVTLTPHTLVIRNILRTEKLALAHITEVGFRRGRLTVACGHGAAAGLRFTVSAVNLGSSRWSGVRGDADAIAEAITGAAGLPLLAPRRQVISRGRAWLMFAAAALAFGLGVYFGPLQIWHTGHTRLPFALYEAGALLYSVGAGMLGVSFRIIRDHRRQRSRNADTDEHK